MVAHMGTHMTMALIACTRPRCGLPTIGHPTEEHAMFNNPDRITGRLHVDLLAVAGSHNSAYMHPTGVMVVLSLTGWPTCRFCCSRCKIFAPACRTTIFTSRPDRLTVYYFTISFPFGSRQRVLHLGSRNVNVEPPFSPVGRTPFTILLFHFHSVPGRAFCISGRET